MSLYECFLFSDKFLDIVNTLQSFGNDKIVTKINNIEKLNFGLSKVIFKLEVSMQKNSLVEKENFIIKFFLGANSEIRKLKEFLILEILYSKGYNVPKPFLHSIYESLTFLLMEYIPGLSLDKILVKGQNEKIKVYFDQMLSFQISLHEIPIESVSEKFNAHNIPFEPSNQLTSYLASFNEIINKSNFIEFRPLYNWLLNNQPNLDTMTFTLVHNDFHPTNMLVANNNDLYFIDWEGISIGYPVIDVSWTMFVTAGICGDKLVEKNLTKIYLKLTNTKLKDSSLEYYMILCASWRLVVFTIILNDVQGVRENDSTFKERILLNYREPIKYFIKRINEITSLTFPSLEKKLIKS